MKKIPGLIVLLMAAHVYAQQPMVITGRVIDQMNSAPLEKVSVTITGSKSGALTDNNGMFTIRNVKAGKYQLNFSIIGYSTIVKPVQITDSSLSLDIRMQQRSGDLSGVTVVGLTEEQAEAKKVRNNVMPVTILSGKEIENRASNLNELLTRQTGVQIRRTGGLGSEARISVRGLEGKRVQVFLDGNPLNTPDGSLGINDLPLQIIERIEIYKGTMPAWLGGDGLGSAVNVVLKHRDYSFIDASASYQSYNTITAGLIVKKTFPKAGIEAGAGVFPTSSDNDYVMRSPFQEGLSMKRDHDRFRSLLSGASVRFHKLWFDEVEVEAGYVKTNKEVQGVQTNIQHAESDGATKVLVLSLKKKELLHNRLSFKYNAVLANINIKFFDTSSRNYDWYGNSYPSITGKGEVGRGPNLSTTVQKEFRHMANVNYKLSDLFSLNLNNTFRIGKFNPTDSLGNQYAGRNLYDYPGELLNTITGFTLETHLPDERLLISSAIKHYYNRVKGYNTNIYLQGEPEQVNNTVNIFGYNTGVRYNLTETWMAKASFERSVRLPLIAELFGDGALITPSILLKPEIANNFTAGIIYDKTDRRERRFQLDANAFYMKVQQMIQLAGAGGLTTGYVNYANVDIVGADAEVKADIMRDLYFNANITWQRLRDINKYLPGTQGVENPTYKRQIPNVPQLFGNWNLEYHKEGLIGRGTKTRVIYEGSYNKRYSYSFNVSRNDRFFIPAYTAHNFVIEQSFQNNRYTVTGEVQNFTNAVIINNWNMPLPGRTFRVKLRYLLISKPHSHQ
jgi:outer membrane receptor protein involved in Fe transport